MPPIDNLPLVLSGVSYRIGDLTLLNEVSLTISAGAPTAIALETSKGDMAMAMGLGLMLIAIVIAINASAWILSSLTKRRMG